jgi:hypothetical protein
MDENEIEHPVEVVQIHRKCKECDTGKMFPTGMILTVYPERYTHECKECGATDSYPVTYPRIEYRDKYSFK